MFSKDAIIKNITNRENLKINFIPTAHFVTRASEEEGYLLSANITGDANEFVADAINFLTDHDYIVGDYKLSYLKKGLFSSVDSEYMTQLLKRFLPDLDDKAKMDLTKIRMGILISNDWNDVMAYFETNNYMYLYAWSTTA